MAVFDNKNSYVCACIYRSICVSVSLQYTFYTQCNIHSDLYINIYLILSNSYMIRLSNDLKFSPLFSLRKKFQSVLFGSGECYKKNPVDLYVHHCIGSTDSVGRVL